MKEAVDEAPERMLIVSVDDHVVEPPDIWTDRLSARYRDAAPRVVREEVPSAINVGTTRWADVWYFGDERTEVNRGFAAAGLDPLLLDTEPMSFDEMRPGCSNVADRLKDMDVDGVEASVCFPNAFVQFCGQRFLRATDRGLGIECVRAYNDWLFDEWMGPSDGRLIGATIIPLWDANLAADEVRRNAARGGRAVCFSEIPARLGLPSMYSGYWEPFFQACADTGTVINVHIGSSSAVHTTSLDAPMAIRISNHFGNSAFSLADWIVSGAFDRHSELKVAFSEGQAGWIPYLLSRLDGLWNSRAPLLGLSGLPKLPSEYLPGHVFACVFDDPVAMQLFDQIGEDSICWETDYPHNDGTWPHSQKRLDALTGGLSPEQKTKVTRINAARLFRIDRVLDALDDQA